MAKGSTHTLATYSAAMCGVLQVPTNHAGLAWIVGTFYALILQSDLDQIEDIGEKTGGYYGLYILEQTFPHLPVIARAWKRWWQLYALMFKHRSFWSHVPPFCTIVRLLYASPITFLFYLMLKNDFPYFVFALICSDTLHFIMDLKVWKLFRILGLEIFQQ